MTMLVPSIYINIKQTYTHHDYSVRVNTSIAEPVEIRTDTSSDSEPCLVVCAEAQSKYYIYEHDIHRVTLVIDERKIKPKTLLDLYRSINNRMIEYLLSI